MSALGFSPIEEIVSEISAGRLVIVADDFTFFVGMRTLEAKLAWRLLPPEAADPAFGARRTFATR